MLGIHLAPETRIKNVGLDATALDQAKRLNCDIRAAYNNSRWETDQDISIKEIINL